MIPLQHLEPTCYKGHQRPWTILTNNSFVQKFGTLELNERKVYRNKAETMYKFIQLFEMDRFLTKLFSFHYDTVNLYASKHRSVRP